MVTEIDLKMPECCFITFSFHVEAGIYCSARQPLVIELPTARMGGGFPISQEASSRHGILTSPLNLSVRSMRQQV